jgi:hypothetical protein
MGISVFPPKTGTDWSRYTLFSEFETGVAIAEGVTVSLYSVTGKGFLHDCVVRKTNASPADIQVKITLDGVVQFHGRLSNGLVCGLLNLSAINVGFDDATGARSYYTGTLGPPSQSITTLANHPMTDSSLERIVTLSNPLFFKNSLLIEIINADTSGNFYHVAWRGGVI